MNFRRLPPLLFCAALALGGCATGTNSEPLSDKERQAWDSQVGYLTYDKAVTSMGEPESETELPEGRKSCTWIQEYKTTTPSITIFDPATTNPTETRSIGGSVKTIRSEIILTFDKEGVMKNYKVERQRFNRAIP